MDKEHLELQMRRKLTTEEFVSIAQNIWSGEGQELATFCTAKVLLLLGAGASRATPVGLPIMSEFMKALLGHGTTIDTPGTASHLVPRWQQMAPAIHKVVADLGRILKRPADLEEILCLLQMVKGRNYSGPVFSGLVPAPDLEQLVEQWKPNAQLAHEVHKLFLYRIIETYAGVKPEAAAQLYAPYEFWLIGYKIRGRHRRGLCCP